MHWYLPHKISGSVDQALADLQGMGVKFDIYGSGVWYEVKHDGGNELLMKHIGWVVLPDNGPLSCYFRPGCNGRDIRVLLGSTELAMAETPSKTSGWRRTREGGRPRWIAHVMVRVEDDGRDRMASRILHDDRDRWARPLPISAVGVPQRARTVLT